VEALAEGESWIKLESEGIQRSGTA